MHVFKMIKIIPINQTIPSRSRAPVADEYFGIFKINLFWSNWILFISVVLDLSPQVTSA